jgi:hypothetical protein
MEIYMNAHKKQVKVNQEDESFFTKDVKPRKDMVSCIALEDVVGLEEALILLS